MKRGTPILLIGVLLSLPLAIASGRPLLAQESFIGTWDNVDPTRSGVMKVMISVDAGGLKISVSNHDGLVPLHLIGSSIGDETFERALATWVHPDQTTHFILRLDGSRQLLLEDISIFTDESGRSNYARFTLLRRSQS